MKRLLKGMFDRRRSSLNTPNIPNASPSNRVELRHGRRKDDAEQAQMNRWVELADRTLKSESSQSRGEVSPRKATGGGGIHLGRS
ncbi:MAG: hypothetical protein QOD84_853 [Acidobacteriaceae bacterium]|jgi:hypothetical protein